MWISEIELDKNIVASSVPHQLQQSTLADRNRVRVVVSLIDTPYYSSSSLVVNEDFIESGNVDFIRFLSNVAPNEH
jgi:hypothetical protein